MEGFLSVMVSQIKSDAGDAGAALWFSPSLPNYA